MISSGKWEAALQMERSAQGLVPGPACLFPVLARLGAPEASKESKGPPTRLPPLELMPDPITPTPPLSARKEQFALFMSIRTPPHPVRALLAAGEARSWPKSTIPWWGEQSPAWAPSAGPSHCPSSLHGPRGTMVPPRPPSTYHSRAWLPASSSQPGLCLGRQLGSFQHDRQPILPQKSWLHQSVAWPSGF